MNKMRTTIWTLGVAALVCASMGSADAGKKKLSADDQLRWDAARALYGHGIKIKRSRKSATFAPKPGGLNQAIWNTYVEKFYLPTLPGISVKRKDTSFRWAKEYGDEKWSPRAKVKRAHLLLETRFKYELCKSLVSELQGVDSIAKTDYYAHCVQQAIIEATSNVFEYRGTKVIWDGKRNRGDLALNDEIFVKDSSGNYPILLTLAGGRESMSSEGMIIAEQMLYHLPEYHKSYKKTWALFSKRNDGYHKLVKRMAKKQKKLAKGKVAFAEEQFFDWEARSPVKGPVSCKKLFYLAYAPKKKRKNGYWEQVSIDQQWCSGTPIAASEIVRGIFDNLRGCVDGLASGTHTVEVGVHRMIIEAEWKEKRLTKKLKVIKVNQQRGGPGKKHYSAKIQCTVP